MQRHIQLGNTVSEERFWNEMPRYEFINAMFTLPAEFKSEQPEEQVFCFAYNEQ